MATVWMGPMPDKCDTCGTSIDGKFYDAATKMGPWACMCPSCQVLGPTVKCHVSIISPARLDAVDARSTTSSPRAIEFTGPNGLNSTAMAAPAAADRRPS